MKTENILIIVILVLFVSFLVVPSQKQDLGAVKKKKNSTTASKRTRSNGNALNRFWDFVFE